jgi:hypothetical protein
MSIGRSARRIWESARWAASASYARMILLVARLRSLVTRWASALSPARPPESRQPDESDASELRFWPHDVDPPPGWVVVSRELGHHSRYSVLIERVQPWA